VTTKLAETRRRIAELRRLTSELEGAAAHLATPADDGPCDGGCACMTAPVPARATR
jgi:hypothetical protein